MKYLSISVINNTLINLFEYFLFTCSWKMHFISVKNQHFSCTLFPWYDLKFSQVFLSSSKLLPVDLLWPSHLPQQKSNFKSFSLFSLNKNFIKYSAYQIFVQDNTNGFCLCALHTHFYKKRKKRCITNLAAIPQISLTEFSVQEGCFPAKKKKGFLSQCVFSLSFYYVFTLDRKQSLSYHFGKWILFKDRLIQYW